MKTNPKSIMEMRQTRQKEEKMEKDTMKSIGLFLGGVLAGTAGVKILSSTDAKKVYVQATAAALRAKDSVLDTVTTVQENAEDVLAEAKEVNRTRREETTEEQAEEKCE